MKSNLRNISLGVPVLLTVGELERYLGREGDRDLFFGLAAEGADGAKIGFLLILILFR